MQMEQSVFWLAQNEKGQMGKDKWGTDHVFEGFLGGFGEIGLFSLGVLEISN